MIGIIALIGCGAILAMVQIYKVAYFDTITAPKLKELEKAKKKAEKEAKKVQKKVNKK